MPEDAIAIADTRQPRQAHVKCGDLSWARSNYTRLRPWSFDGKDPKDPSIENNKWHGSGQFNGEKLRDSLIT